MTNRRTSALRAFAAFFLIAAVTLCTIAAAPRAAWADNPCELTDEMRAQYEADGTLADRIAFVESLNSDSQAELIAAAQQRSGEAAVASSNVPSGWVGGMGTTGDGYILCVAVEFPAEGDEPATTFADAKQQAKSVVASIEGGSGYAAPYESLQAYYQRASYGKLNIGCRSVCYNVTAKHCRSYYDGIPDALVIEIATTLDEQFGVDFSQYDGNDDGFVDGIYLIYAGLNTGWGSTWWPHCGNSLDHSSPTFDGKKLKNDVFIGDVTRESSAKTFIHETGHVLGLPDYYSYYNTTKGIATTDMMNQNEGDHNAFSKWLLGWIDDSQITRIAITDNAIKVRRGAGEVQTYTGSVTETIKAFTSDTITEGGGFIAVSSDEGILTGPLFRRFYLLQYDRPAGNQAFSNDGGLVSGLRIYRVQAQLNTSGTNFELSCSGATSQHNMLIESLCPSDGGAKAETGNPFHTGASIGASTTPSTNYREDPLGYTGIHIDVTNADDPAEGSVTFSHDAKPPETEFTVTPAFSTGILDVGAYYFTPSLQPNWTKSDLAGAKLVIDGTSHDVRTLDKDGNLLVYYELPSGTITQDSTCELVLPAGFFELYGTQSAELHVALHPRSKTIAFESSGTYEQSEYQLNGASEVLSSAVTAKGEQIIVAAQSTDDGNGTKLALLKLSSDGKSCTQVAVKGSEVGDFRDVAVTAIALNDGRIFAWVNGHSGKESTTKSMAFWIDPATGGLLDSRDITDLTFSGIAPLGDGIALLTQSPGPNVTCAIRQIFSSDASKDKNARGECGVFATELKATGDGRIAGISIDQDTQLITVSIYSTSEIEKLLEGGEGKEATPDVSFPVANARNIEDLTFRDGKFYVLAAVNEDSVMHLELRTLDNDGNTLSTTKIEGGIASNMTRSKLLLSESGAAAITTTYADGTTAWTTSMEIAMLDPDGNFAGFSSTKRSNIAFWADNRLYVTQRQSDSAAEVGKIGWIRTAAVGGNTPTPDPEPTPAPTPEPEPTPAPAPDPEQNPGADSQAPQQAGTQQASATATGKNAGSSTLAKTGDMAAAPVEAALASLVASLLIATIARRKERGRS